MSSRARPGSSHSKRERGAAKERRKPARGGKAASTVAGSHHNGVRCKPAPLGAPVDGRRFGPEKPSALTSTRRKRSSPPAHQTLTREVNGGEREASEIHHQLGTRSKTPRSGGTVSAVASLEPSDNVQLERWLVRSKLAARRQARGHPGLGRRKMGLAQQGAWSCGSKAFAVQRVR